MSLCTQALRWRTDGAVRRSETPQEPKKWDHPTDLMPLSVLRREKKKGLRGAERKHQTLASMPCERVTEETHSGAYFLTIVE